MTNISDEVADEIYDRAAVLLGEDLYNALVQDVTLLTVRITSQELFNTGLRAPENLRDGILWAAGAVNEMADNMQAEPFRG